MKIDAKKKKILLITGGLLLAGGITYYFYNQNKKKKVLLLQQEIDDMPSTKEGDQDGYETTGAAGTLTASTTPSKQKPTVKTILGNVGVVQIQALYKVARIKPSTNMQSETTLSMEKALPSTVVAGTKVQIQARRSGRIIATSDVIINRVSFGGRQISILPKLTNTFKRIDVELSVKVAKS